MVPRCEYCFFLLSYGELVCWEWVGDSERTREAASAGAGGEERAVFDVFEVRAERGGDESEVRGRDDEVVV